ncbi:cell wall hydrolase [Lichenihabitans sp. PAMC28606]|uniref:cell wall hydrolase n=1 Tax=Lichenihabitans sp. PAMC28606 TaxID=2880932 RepID=UPI001D09A364|nr:cell wall hydrolase [Lichenihabitans sp. PAMC28606]UDL95025.1 cell wall hydrolase [Lichenihabitans sp. PAMC28606]
MVPSRIGVRTKVKRRSRMAWACGTVAPWCAALVMLVSYAADAGQDPRVDASQSFRLYAAAAPAVLVPSSDAGEAFRFQLPKGDQVVQQARLVIGDPSEFQAAADEIDPNPALKPQAKIFPSVDRSHKGDPTVGLRPTFDAKLRKAGSLQAARGASLVFSDENPQAEPMGFTPNAGPAPGPESVATFVPMPDGKTLTTTPSSSDASPQQGSGATTPHMQDGSTPTVARALALDSTTPVESDSTPVEIAALPKFSRGPQGVVTGNTTVVGITPAHPDYAALIDSTKASSEQKCLAEAIYFEARSEPEEGQAAVAQVVLNRVSSGLYPQSVCGVVFQNQQRHNACQFSFACEGRALRITETDAWAQAVRVAHEVTEGSAYVSDVGGATHYHAKYVRPFWASRLKRMDVIGHHVFYKLRPGQT